MRYVTSSINQIIGFTWICHLLRENPSASLSKKEVYGLKVIGNCFTKGVKRFYLSIDSLAIIAFSFLYDRLSSLSVV